jgi:hypothetical protein
MRTQFLTPSGKTVEIAEPVRTLWSGGCGAKSRALLERLPLIERIGRETGAIETVPMVSVTTDFCREFSRRAGGRAKKLETVTDRIYKATFLESERELLAEAIRQFKGLYIAVRSDEATPAGVGLWHTGFMIADVTKESIGRLEEIVRRIVLSDISENVLAFKKRTGIPIDSGVGVLIMPVAGRQLADSGDVFTSIFHANLITNFTGTDTLINLGIGIGGANNCFSNAFHMSYMTPSHFMSLGSGTLGNMMGTNALSGGEIKNLSEFEREDERMGMVIKSGNYVATTMEQLRLFVQSYARVVGGTAYAEIAHDGRCWNLLQSADATLGEVKKPSIRDRQEILTAEGITAVSGRRTFEARKVFFMDGLRAGKFLELGKFNEHEHDYVIVFKDISVTELSCMSFRDYSNVGAVLFEAEGYGHDHSMATHANGATREAGIVLLEGSFDPGFLAGLKEGPNDRNLIIYANDANYEGFVAIKK